MKPKLYAERDAMALGQLYVDHVQAMTSEGLHEKSDIAAELAWRDLKLKQAQFENLRLLRDVIGVKQ